MMKRILIFGFLCLIHVRLIAAENQEYLIKAVFLEKFTHFVDWPQESAVYDTTRPFVIGVIGKNPFGDLLENVYKTQKILDKKVIIILNVDTDLISNCQMIFISGSEKSRLREILRAIQNQPILTISDTEGFARQGVMINFYIEEEMTKFEINEQAVRKSPLKISYLLLNMARIVK